MKKINFLLALSLICLAPIAFNGCKEVDPPLENEEEVIDLVRLTFTPIGGTPVSFEAVDADGEGPGDFTIPTITLIENTEYTLAIEVENSAAGTDITSEIYTEGEEHMFFFAWNSGAFSSPAGDGNIDLREDGTVNYSDEDLSGQPIGLNTTWTTSAAGSGSSFRIMLKHQPGTKSATSTSQDGETDIDLTWAMTIQ